MIRTIRSASLAAIVFAAPVTAQQTVNLPAKDVAIRAVPSQVFTVGVEEGRQEEMFSGVRAVAFDRNDNLFVLDQQNFRVAMFDARGRFVRTIGRRGQGPGELQAPFGLAVTEDGNVVVSDVANRAFVVYRSTGEHVRNIPFSSGLGLIDMRNGLQVDARSGAVVGRASPRLSPEDQATSQRATIFRQPLSEGAATQTISSFEIPAPRIIDRNPGAEQRRVMMVNMDPIFGPRPSFGVLPDGGVALTTSDDYTVRVLDAAGRPQRVLRRSGFAPRKVTKQDQDAWKKRRDEAQASGTAGAPVVVTANSTGGSPTVSFGSGNSASAAAMQSIRMTDDMLTFAERMSVITGLRTDPQGRLWIQRRNANGEERGPIDIVAANGNYIGTLPAQPMPDAISRSGLAAWIVRDDMGIERVSVRRLAGPLAAAR